MEDGGDMHLSARKISSQSILELSHLGFTRDEFVNNTRCEISEYHGTYRGEIILPNSNLWSEVVSILKKDKDFEGGLEEEIFNSSRHRFKFDNDSSSNLPEKLESIEINKTPKGRTKKCDIHININLSKSENLSYLECLNITSFERVKDEDIHRIYTVTLSDLKLGYGFFNLFKKYLASIPNINGEMKFELCSKFYRFPKDAPVLPIITNSFATEYLNNSKTF